MFFYYILALWRKYILKIMVIVFQHYRVMSAKQTLECCNFKYIFFYFIPAVGSLDFLILFPVWDNL